MVVAHKYRYKVINKHGIPEPWSGIFQNAKEADAWYEKHGKFHEQRGFKLVRVKCTDDEKP